MWRLACVLLIACGSSKPAPAPVSNTTSTPAEPAAAPVSPDAMAEHRRALAELDDANPRSVDRATKAADALAGQDGAIGDLGALAVRPPSKKLIPAQIAAIRSLGKMANKPAAVVALAQIVERELPQHPNRGGTEDEYALHLATLGATINAITELGDPNAARMLVPVIYRAPELAQQLRRAFAMSGSVAGAEFRKVLRGEHAQVDQLIKAKKLDQYCGDRGELPKCLPLGIRDFYAAIVLGDVRESAAVPDLLAVLGKPALPPYYVDEAAAPSTQHTAVFDALRKLGARDAAAKLKSIWANPKADVNDRIGAVGAYAFCAPDAKDADAIWKIAADNTADDSLRVEAATAFARLANDKKMIPPIFAMAKKYVDASAKKRAAADKLQAVKTAADGELQNARDASDAARAKLLATTQDQTSTADQIRAQTEVAKRADADFKAAKKKHREKISAWSMNDTAAKAYVGYARMFQTHVARVELAVRCADNLDCYATALKTTPSDAVLQLRASIPDVAQWSDDEKQGLVEAYVDRAVLELGRRPGGDAKTGDIVALLASDNRLIREAALLHVARLAKCPSCNARLDAVVEADRGKTHIAALALETQIVRLVLRSR